MSSFRVVRRMLCAAAGTAAAPAAPAAPAAGSRWERLKASKAGVWCRSLVSDYKEACREVVVGAWERPIKASVYMALLGGTWACFHTKPDQTSFEAALLERTGQLGLLSPWIRNATSDTHVQSLVKLQSEGRLRHISLGILTLVYCADYDPNVTLYEAQCSNLSVPWRELPQRMLDVGFVGRWWILDSKMKDYDVNEEEFKHLPVHMQLTLPPGVQEVERSEKLHRESWLPLTMEDEEADTNAVDRKTENVNEESPVEANILKQEQTQV